MMQDDIQRYIPIDGQGKSGEPESRAAFMIRGLLSSRIEVGTESEAEDQDVNIYLMHLLCSYIDPVYQLRIVGYLSAYDSTLFERIQHSTSTRLKYTVYKINADHLLMLIGVFQNPSGRRADALPAALQTSGDVHFGRAKTYYDFASTYGHSVFGRSSAIAGVLGKLSTGFEKYVRILGHMRGEYLNFIEHMSDGELYHLQRSAQAEGLSALRNDFLDAYSAYRREPAPERRARMLELAGRLQRLDPDFHFEMPQ